MLTLVPARGGSKRLPRKNVRLLAGVPLLLWTLIPFRHLNPVVSSDDAAILSLAKEHGFDVIERPEDLATDTATSADVALHALDVTGEDSVLLLQPTTPYRDKGTVSKVLRVFVAHGKPALAVRDVPHAFKNGKHIRNVETPSGSAYVISKADLAEHRSFMPVGYQTVLDTSIGALEIDYEDEWQHAEAIALFYIAALKREMGAQAGVAA